jgi:hypothetical protein
MAGVGEELAVDGVADASFQGAEGFFAGLAFGLFAFVVGAAGGVVADLSDRREVQGVVELAVASRVESVPGPWPGRGLDRGGGVVAGVVPGGREPGDVAAVAEDDRRDDGADAVDVGVVPAIATAPVMRFLSLSIWSSRRRTSASRSMARALRSMSTRPRARRSSSAARADVSLRRSGLPPGMSRHNRAWSRHTAWVRKAVRAQCPGETLSIYCSRREERRGGPITLWTLGSPLDVTNRRERRAPPVPWGRGSGAPIAGVTGRHLWDGPLSTTRRATAPDRRVCDPAVSPVIRGRS